MSGPASSTARHSRPTARHAYGAARHAGPRVRSKPNVRSPLAVLRRAELVLLVVVGVPLLLLVLPTTLGGRAGWTVVVGRSMEPTIDPGDMVLTRAQSDYTIGDVVVYAIPDGSAGSGVMVIHRITGGSAAEGYVTTGDNRDFADPWRPKLSEIVGRHWRTIPSGGYVIAWLRSPLAMGLATAAAAYSVTLQFTRGAFDRSPTPRHARRTAV